MEIDPELLRRYWKNECSEAEKQQVERWLEAGEPDEDYGIGDDLDEDMLQRELWASVAPEVPPTPIQVQRIDLPERNIPARRRNFIFASGIAASIAFIGVFMFLGRLPDKGMELPIAQYEEIVAPYGKKVTVTLPDGTMIQLNSGSALRYPKEFSAKRRHVMLDGEAFFHVAKDPTRPFLAETARSNTHVLGTRFNLRDFNSEPNSSIVVEEGRVQFTGNGSADSLVLLAGDRAVFTGNAIQKSEVQASAYTDWKENILRFNDITLEEAIPMIERWYNVHITLRDPALGTLKIKGSFRQKPFRKLMDDFSYLMNLRYSIDKQQVLLYK